jgi:two-component sensor histidine kinase
MLTLFSAAIYYRTGHAQWGVYSLSVIATLTTYVLFVTGDYYSVVFFTIVPLGYFLLFSFRESLLYTAIHFGIVMVIYFVARGQHPDLFALHDVRYLETAFMGALMILIIGIVYHITIESSYRRLALSNARNETLLREIHHRVKNNLNLIAALLGMQKMNSDCAEVHTLVEQNRLRLESIAMVHEMIYQQDDLEKISFEAYITRLADHVMRTESSDHRIRIESRMVPLVLPIDRMIYFGILLNEMVTNSIKHAFGDRDGRITLTLESDDGAAYRFTYRDNGPGWEDSAGGEGFGTRVIAMSVAQLDATMEENHRTGAGYHILFARERS